MAVDDSTPESARNFATTQWSMVLQAGRECSPEAWSALCETYWYPLYAFVRRQGHSVADAQDLTQGFFLRLIERRDLDAVDRSKGRFRSFLLVAMKHFLINEWDKQRAEKRGGTRTKLSLDFDAAESRYSLEPSHERTADAIFDREWALMLLEHVGSQLACDYESAGKRELFDQLQVFLTADGQGPSYREAGDRLGMTEGAVKVAVHRLRARFRDLLRGEIGRTVAAESEIDDEIRALFDALRG